MGRLRRKRFDEIDRVDVGDTLVGTALAASPPDQDGEWPGLAVRNLLERLRNDKVDSGLSIAVVNQSGVTSRSPTPVATKSANSPRATEHRVATSASGPAPQRSSQDWPAATTTRQAYTIAKPKHIAADYRDEFE